MKINVLGTDYEIYYSDESSEEFDAICDTSIKKVTIFKNALPQGERAKEDLGYVAQKILRHELAHAFIYKAGVDIEFFRNEEQLVDWIAIQFPKMYQAFKDAKILCHFVSHCYTPRWRKPL